MVFRTLSLLMLGISLTLASACTPAPPRAAGPAPRPTGAAPRTFLAQYEAGRILLGNKQYASALKALARALTLAPPDQRTTVLADIGYCHLQLQQVPQALEDCQQILLLDPTYHYGYYLRSSVYAQMKDFDKSIADLEHCLVLKPEDPMTLKLLGTTYFLKNDFSTALSVFDDLAKTGQDKVYVQNFRAKLFRKLGRDDDASAALEAVLAEDPTFADAYYLMGLICEDHKAYADALDAYGLYLKYANANDPDNTPGILDVKQRIRKMRFKQILTFQ